MFIETCKQMVKFHSEVLRIRYLFKKLGYNYEDELSEEYHIDNKYFYQNLVSLSSTKRAAHIPKIIIDKIRMKKWLKYLHANKQTLKVHNMFKLSGAGFTKYSLG